MLDRLLGVSKQTFLAKYAIPSREDDKFNDGKCIFCWGPYDNEHPAVRVLPCNHVFGRDCLVHIIDAPNGDHCPICRTSLFQPPLSVELERALDNGINRLTLFLMFATHKFEAFWRQLPGWIKFPLRFRWHMNNVYYYTEMFLDCFTNVRARNPGLPWTGLVRSQWFYSEVFWGMTQLLDWMYDLLISNRNHELRKDFICYSIYDIALAFFLLHAVYDRFSNKRDRALFLFLMVAVMFIQGLMVAAIHPNSKEKIFWTMLGTTKDWIGGIAARHRST